MMGSRLHPSFLLLALLPLACAEHRAPVAVGQPVTQTLFKYLLRTQWSIDLLFVIDNSASMAAKQPLLLQSLAKMMRSLSRFDGGLLDMRIGVISTDVGAGEGVVGGDCSARLGDQGLLWGNDPTPGALASVADSPGNGCGLARGVRWIEDRICADGSKRIRNYEGELADVLSCMGGALGNHGCGYSHALQSLSLALNPVKGINEANEGFLRRGAPLVIVIISDKDDCSADPSAENNDGMFSAKNPGDSPVLRCAARGHVCDGNAIPHYDPSTGYDGRQGPWTADFNACTAKQPSSPRDPHWLPLISVQDAIDRVRQVKDAGAIVVVGVMGWPGEQASAQVSYRIDQGKGTGVWELAPICGAPSVQGDGGGVYPAYRLRQFVEGFRRHEAEQVSFDMCRGDWDEAIVAVSDATCCYDSRPPCLYAPLADVDPKTPGVQHECQVSLWFPGDDTGDCGGQPAHDELIPECLDPLTGLPVDPDDPRPQLDGIPAESRPCWYLVHDADIGSGCPDAFEHQKFALLFKPGHFPPQGGMVTTTCRTSPYPPVDGKRAE